MSEDNETLAMLRDAAAGLARPDGPRVRALRGSALGFEREKWSAMAEQGWLSILVGEDDGGLGLDAEACCVVAERLGYAAAPEPFVASGVLVPALLAHVRASRERSRLLASVLSGEVVATVAWQNEAGSLDPGDTGLAAKQNGSEVLLSGSARFVPVPEAELLIVSARGASGLSLHAVSRHAAGVTMTRETGPDGGATGWLQLSGVRVAAADTLASGVPARAAFDAALDTATVAVGAELVGLMERELEMTLEYLRTRKQFGQAIGSFQALQHRAVDLWTQKELARHAVDAAARTIAAHDVAPRARAIAASSAKYRASDAAMRLAKECIQLHGAIGFTDEYDLGLYVNRTLALQAWLGNAAEHRKRYGALARITEAAQ